jgi:hypothetical protein
MSYISSDYLNHINEETCHQLITTHVQLNYHPDISDILFVKACHCFADMYLVGTQGNRESGLNKDKAAA